MDITSLQENSIIYNFVYKFLGTIEGISQTLLAFTVIFFICYTVYNNIKRKGDENDYIEMFLRIGIVLIALSCYQWWTVQIADMIIRIAEKLDQSDMSMMDTALEKAWKNMSKMANFWDVKSFLFYCMLWASFVIYGVATEAFQLVQFFIQIILWVLGPIPITMSLLPIYRDAFKMWLGNFIAINFWSVIYAIMVIFFHETMVEKYGDLNSRNFNDVEAPIFFTELLVFTIIFFGLIASIPIITGFVLPFQNLSGLSTMIGAASLAAVSQITKAPTWISGAGGAIKTGANMAVSGIRKVQNWHQGRKKPF